MTTILGDLGNLIPITLHSGEQIVQGVGNAAALIPSFGRVVIRVIDSARYLALGALVVSSIWLVRQSKNL